MGNETFYWDGLIGLEKWHLLVSSCFLISTSGDNNLAVVQATVSLLSDQNDLCLRSSDLTRRL